MKHLRLALILVGLFLVGTTVAGVAPPPAAKTDPRGYVVLDQNLEPFRSDFNAKADHVRAVLLVGPT